ncbi:hypothetical protein ABL78_6362 [Leptomonas seymouri]|uniref:Folate/biopterin transporter n=1 Tax=Leptomonas seymouri TaxID=5684 RepID=A0A0N1I3H1_LEPSE|nr:hypothetical protein ABL78_6362 [Leptomonas seymouri]|eukprot:KPI84601.1 hypothetical protein ABL78_6362 [Leptomonas seymouri]
MTKITAGAKVREGGWQRHVTTPASAAEALCSPTPPIREAQRMRHNGKEELLNTAARLPSTTTAAVPDASAAPVIVMTSKHSTEEPLLLPSLSSPPHHTIYRGQPQQGDDARADVIAEQLDVTPTTQTKGTVNAAREEHGQCEGGVEGGFARVPLDGEARPKEFQCPRVPRMVLVLLVCTALVQGFSSSAISLFINMELALGPVEVTRYWMYIGYTAWCQPALGYVSDALVLFREKRRPLFILAAIGNTLIFFLYCVAPAVTDTYGRLVALSIVSQFFTMGLYIPLNGLVVEVGRHDAETEEESTARMSAIMSKTMVWRSIGSLIGNILQTCFVTCITVRSLLGVTSLFFLILVPIVLATPRRLFLRAGSQDQNFYKRVVEAGRLVWRSFDVRDIRSDGFCFLIVLGFVFVYTLMPDAGSVYYNYLYGAYTFPMWFYSLNNCIGFLGSIAGAYAFSLWMDQRSRQEARGGTRTSMFFIFMIGSFASAFGYITNLLLCTGFVTGTLGVSAAVYVPVDNFFTSMFSRFAFMPTITMAAEHAPKFFEATTFEVFSVASIGGGTISSLLTSIIAQDLGISRADYNNLWILMVMSIVLKLVPIPLAYLLPERHRSTEELPTAEVDAARVREEEEAVPQGVAETKSAGAEGGCGAPAEVFRLTQRQGPSMSQASEDECDPSLPLKRIHRNSL